MKIHFIHLLIVPFVLIMTLSKNVQAQVTITPNQTAQQLVNKLTGEGVIVLNPILNGTCPGTAQGLFNFNGYPSDIGIDSGIVLTSGSAIQIPNPASAFASASFNGPGDPDLNTLLSNAGSSASTNDACVLQFDFVPAGDSIKFDYVFGSEEYPEFACSGFNDVFGFLISGPGFTGLTNMAVVPNTNIPVAINTINMAPAGTSYGVAACNAMGTGSPFSQYYVDNQGNNNQHIVYDGFTTVLTAKAAVNPCDTYHLKLAIADAGDFSYDSGVFLKAGSLTSTAISVETFGGAGLEVPFTNTVRGCPPGKVVIRRNGGFNQSITIPLEYTGTAVNGVDYAALPPSVTIPVGDSVAVLYVSGIPLATPVGVKTCIISALSPYTCGNGAPIILGSDTINIYDSIYVKILTNDTIICIGESVSLTTEGDSILKYSWNPFSTVDDPEAKNVIVTPTETTTYTVSVTLDVLTACPSSSDKVKITVRDTPVVNLGPDIAVCGTATQLNAETQPFNPDETFTWTPAAGLSSTTIRNPIANPTATTEYVVVVNAGPAGCDGRDTIIVRMLPDHITVLNSDTVVCAGTVLDLLGVGDTAFQYNWTPEPDILNPFVPVTKLTAQQSGYYTLTASFPGCSPMTDSFYVEVQPIPKVDIGSDRIICAYDTIQFYAAVSPDYNQYSYDWTPGVDFSDSTIKNPVFQSSPSLGKKVGVTVKTPIGCSGSDSVNVIINPGDFLTVNPTDTIICPQAKVQLTASGAVSYSWTPAWGLTNPASANPIAQPEATTTYTLIGYNQYQCRDTQLVHIQVAPNSVVYLEDSVTLFPGESYQMNPQGNGLYYSWFPPSGLSAVNISNPIANPEVRTRYFVTSTTEHGCSVKDSIDVLVSLESILDAPNAFTPGNGINNLFKVIKRGSANLKSFKVYNRWGNVIFETTDINQGWDGNYKNSPQPMGVYIYSIEAQTLSGKMFRKDGNVTLIR